MGRREEYRQRLRGLSNWEGLLLAESGLPGPRGNLELLAAVADEGDTTRFLDLLHWTPERARTGSREEFLAACGATGLGESIAKGEEHLWSRLRGLASDPRWRVREGVAMALQRIGDGDMNGLLRRMSQWVEDGPLERRAVAAGLCEPRLLENGEDAEAVLRLSPDAGKKRFERWAGSSDRDVRWIVRENLKKKRLERMDSEWVKDMRQWVV